MKIKYVQINDTDVKAIATWDKEYPEHTNKDICEMLIRTGIVAKSDITMANEFSSTSHASGKDVFNYKTGCDVARDKVLIKYNSELARVLENYEEGLKTYIDRINYLRYISEQKIDRAYERYIRY